MKTKRDYSFLQQIKILSKTLALRLENYCFLKLYNCLKKSYIYFFSYLKISTYMCKLQVIGKKDAKNIYDLKHCSEKKSSICEFSLQPQKFQKSSKEIPPS